MMGKQIILNIKLSTHISHTIFPISYQQLGWSLMLNGPSDSKSSNQHNYAKSVDVAGKELPPVGKPLKGIPVKGDPFY